MDIPFDDKRYVVLVQDVRAGNYGRLEDQWLELCDKPDIDLDAFCLIAEMLAEKGQTDRAATLLLMLLPPLAERNEQGNGLKVVRRVVEYSRDPEEVREFAIDAFMGAMRDRSDIAAALELSGIRGTTPLKAAIAQLDDLLFVDEGDYVFHDGGWNIGRITSVDISNQSVTVDFETLPNHRVSSKMAPKILRKLPPDDFEVLRWTDINRLREMAANDPAELLRSVLRSVGRKLGSKEIKSRLADTIIEAPAWSKWWASARRQAQKDPYIDIDGQKFSLRAVALTPEREALEQISAASTLIQRMALAIDFLKKSGASDRSPEALTEMASLIAQSAAQQKSLPARIEAAFLVEDLVKSGATAPEGILPTPAEMLGGIADDTTLVINGMTHGDFQRRSLRVIQETQPDTWPRIYEQVLFDSRRDLWDFIIKELLDSGHGELASNACLRVAGDHSSHAELYLWLCRSAFAGRFEAILGGHDEFILLENLLSLLDELADPRRDQPDDTKKLLARGKDVLGMQDFEQLDRIVAPCTEEEARRIRDMIAYNRGITDPTRRSIANVIKRHHASLFESPTTKEEDQPIYTTPAGLKKVQDEYDRLMNVSIPANQKALGAALDFGDVSDNAELRAAREEQAGLARRADHLSTQLSRIAVLDPGLVKTDEAAPGTRVTVHNIDNDTEETYTIMGPWDADPERGIISHLAPLAQSLLGKNVGDSAQAEIANEVRNYEIISIELAQW